MPATTTALAATGCWIWHLPLTSKTLQKSMRDSSRASGRRQRIEPCILLPGSLRTGSRPLLVQRRLLCPFRYPLQLGRKRG